RVLDRRRDAEDGTGTVPSRGRTGATPRVHTRPAQGIHQTGGTGLGSLPRLPGSGANLRAVRLHRAARRVAVLSPDELRVVGFTLRIAALGTVLLLVPGITVALALARYQGPGKSDRERVIRL